MDSSEKRPITAYVVVAAGIGINLALGILYAWSVIKGGLPDTWSASEKALPYAIACLAFALSSVPAGKLQDRFGPRWVATLGGVLMGGGLLLASQVPTVLGYILGFGLMAGSGIGLGYAAATPAAVKWFPPHRTGLVAGLVVAGFGIASAYISPLVKHMLAAYRPTGVSAAVATSAAVSKTMFILGLIFLGVTVALAQLLRNPPVAAGGKKAAARPAVNASAGEMLRTPQFYILWVMFCFAAGAGLMVISTMSQLTKSGAEKFGFILVALLALGNAGGRVVAGVVSDRIGKPQTMRIVFALQAALMFSLVAYKSFPLPVLIAVAVLIGANYGANLSVFPSISKEYWGLKNFGFNYGILFTSWGIGGFLLSFVVAGKIKDWTGEYTLAFVIAGVMLVVAAALTFAVKAPTAATASVPAAQPEVTPAVLPETERLAG